MTPTRHASIHAVKESEGSVVIIVMMFILVILALAAALFSMVKFSIGGTELERKEVKAFNVAEAGLDAGMRTLKLRWPTDTPPAFDKPKFRLEFDLVNFPDPTSGAGADDFINVVFRDDDNLLEPPSTTSPAIDANNNGRLWVYSEANVANDRHNILALAERAEYQLLDLTLPDYALYASVVEGNMNNTGHGGLQARVDEHQSSIPSDVRAYYGTDDGLNTVSTKKNDNPQLNNVGFQTDEDLITAALINALEKMAQSQGTYYDDDDTTTWPSIATGVALLTGPNAANKTIYLKSTTPITITANTQLPQLPQGEDAVQYPRANPILLILDAPGLNTLNFRGTADFFGRVISTGSLDLVGDSSFYGQVLARGTIKSSGLGSDPEINYNRDIMERINFQTKEYPMAVSMVANTWEEYTVARTTATTTP